MISTSSRISRKSDPPRPARASQALRQLQLQVRQLAEENKALRSWTEEAVRGESAAAVAEWAGKVGHLVFRQAREKLHLESQMEKSRSVQASMKGEVMALKEMVQAAVEDYEKQLRRKDALLKEKDEEIQILIRQLKTLEGRPADDRLTRPDDSRNQHKDSLEVIQEESEHATHSSAATLREFRDDGLRLPESMVSETEISCGPVTICNSSPEIQQETCEPRFEHRRTKTFIDHFRKTIGESFSEKEEEKQVPVLANTQKQSSNSNVSISNTSSSHNSNRLQTNTVSAVTCKQPLKELSSNEQAKPYSYSQNMKGSSKQVVPANTKTLTLLMECTSNSVSHSSSSSDLIISGEAERISLPKKFETPINLMAFKKKETPVARVMTEPSPERAPANPFFTANPSRSHKRIFHEKKSSCQKSLDDSKSVKSSLSKEKIKITAKMVEESRPKPAKALVYLGGKSVFRKFLLELKAALKLYTITTAFPEHKYEGGRRGSTRWGQGRVLYQNGCVYEGEFRQGVRWGRGRLSLNGIAIYEGEWSCDRVSGQGYIKSMRFMGSGGGAIFNEASYCGNLLENRLHGIGTLFLNAKEKIVTKFAHGVPTGELTYYNFHEIEFGVWPAE